MKNRITFNEVAANGEDASMATASPDLKMMTIFAASKDEYSIQAMYENGSTPNLGIICAAPSTTD